jgi:hypothetical protein
LVFAIQSPFLSAYCPQDALLELFYLVTIEALYIGIQINGFGFGQLAGVTLELVRIQASVKRRFHQTHYEAFVRQEFRGLDFRLAFIGLDFLKANLAVMAVAVDRPDIADRTFNFWFGHRSLPPYLLFDIIPACEPKLAGSHHAKRHEFTPGHDRGTVPCLNKIGGLEYDYPKRV